MACSLPSNVVVFTGQFRATEVPADAEIMVPTLKNPELSKVLTFKPAVGQLYMLRQPS